MIPHPGGRPRALTAVQEQQVYDRINATRRGRRCFVFSELAHDLGVGVSTLERIVTEKRRQHFAEIVGKFHKEPQNSTTPTSGRNP